MKTSISLILLSLICQLFARQASGSPATESYGHLRTNLYIMDPDCTNVLMDGTLTRYDAGFSNEVDGGDARKLTNSSVNFGMIRNSTVLIIERRSPIQLTDSIFFKMWGMGNYNYQLDIVGYNLDRPGLIGMLEDKYLSSSTPLSLNDTTHFYFAVNAEPASKAADRFRIIFVTPAQVLVPISFSFMKAFQVRNKISVTWQTKGGEGTGNFIIERSGGDLAFKAVRKIPAGQLAVNDYQWVDEQPLPGLNYYRIVAGDKNNTTTSEKIMTTTLIENENNLKILQGTDKSVRLKITVQQPCRLEGVIVSSLGQVVGRIKFNHPGGTFVKQLNQIRFSKGGVYYIKLRDDKGGNLERAILVQ